LFSGKYGKGYHIFFLCARNRVCPFSRKSLPGIQLKYRYKKSGNFGELKYRDGQNCGALRKDTGRQIGISALIGALNNELASAVQE